MIVKQIFYKRSTNHYCDANMACRRRMGACLECTLRWTYLMAVSTGRIMAVSTGRMHLMDATGRHNSCTEAKLVVQYELFDSDDLWSEHAYLLYGEPLTAGNQVCFKNLSTSLCFLSRVPFVRLSLPLPCYTALLATALHHFLASALHHFLRQLLVGRAHGLGSRCPLSSLLVVLRCSLIVSDAFQDRAQSSSARGLCDLCTSV